MTAFVGTLMLRPSHQLSLSKRKHVLKCCASTEKSDLKPPTSLESTVSLATQAITNAIGDGHKRVGVTALIPGLNPLIEETVPYSAALLNILAKGLVQYTPQINDEASSSPPALLFASAGTAAAAAAQYKRDAPTTAGNVTEEFQIETASFSKRDGKANRTSPSANVIVAPVSSRGDPIMDDLETIIKENDDALWILLNPDFGADRAAVGMRENARRASFEESFRDTFYFRSLVSKIRKRKRKRKFYTTHFYFLSLYPASDMSRTFFFSLKFSAPE